jgi:hypothetical protein
MMKEAKARGGIAGRETSDSREERSRRRGRMCADCLLAEAHDLGFARCRWHVTVDFLFFHDVRLPPISGVDGWSPPPPPNLLPVSLLTFSAVASACRGDVRRRAVPCPSPQQPTFLLLLLLLLFSHRRRLFCCWVVLGFVFLFQK